MSSILIQFAHPAFSKSRVQKALVAHAAGVEGVTFNDLYEQYPDLYIDVQREQELLVEHDLIILQHPFYWYSSPAIIKQWMDLVLEYNWAYGPRGLTLKGKKVLNVISCGVTKASYGQGGINKYPVNQFLLPFRQTANLCRMEYLPPFVVYGSRNLQKHAVDEYGQQYANLLRALVNDEIDPKQYRELGSMNELVLS